MTCQSQHEMMVSSYHLDSPGVQWVFGLMCSCGWWHASQEFEQTISAMKEHYTAALVLRVIGEETPTDG